MRREVFDLEQFSNFHSAVFYDIDTKKTTKFVIHEARDERVSYFNYLLDLKGTTGLIGYNNLRYDYPLIHFMLVNMRRLLNMPIIECTSELYAEGQKIIGLGKFSGIAPWKVTIKQLDLYRIHHFDNMAKATSLKHLQMAMRWHNLQELPYPFDHYVTEDQIDDILEYNENDVMSTYEFYLETLPKITFRRRMKRMYGIDCMNYPDVKIGEAILIVENAKALNIPLKEFRQMRTKRTFIKLEDCILDRIKFRSKEFNDVLRYFKSKTVHAMNIAGVFEKSVLYGGVKYDFGLGGIHGTNGSGIHYSDNEGNLVLVDVSSYYPNIVIKNRFYPEHLSPVFCDVGKMLYDQRMTAKKNGDTEVVDSIKLALNGALFGKSNDEYSPMYDTEFHLKITVNGQLLLCMLSERISDAGIQVIQINTDGILVKVDDQQKVILDKLCNKWQKMTKLKLDYDYFKTVAQRDVNNYLGVFDDGSIKYKGVFAIEREWNKNHSQRVVAKALEKYYVEGIPVADTILSNKDIFDFCISQKVGKQYQVEYHHASGGRLIKDKVQRLNRFFVSKTGGSLVKVKLEDGSQGRLVAGNSITLFNKQFKSDDYNINYDFYIKEAWKVINAVDEGQISLFD